MQVNNLGKYPAFYAKVFVLGLVATVAACGHPKGAESPANATVANSARTSPSSRAESAYAAGVATKPVELPALGLVGMIPSGGEEPTVHPMPLGIVMVTAAGFAASVNVPGQFDPKTPQEGHENAALYHGENEKSETLADGWSLTFENGAGGGNYFADVYRTIGGKPFFCSTDQIKPAQRDAAVQFCRSLRTK